MPSTASKSSNFYILKHYMEGLALRGDFIISRQVRSWWSLSQDLYLTLNLNYLLTFAICFDKMVRGCCSMVPDVELVDITNVNIKKLDISIEERFFG